MPAGQVGELRSYFYVCQTTADVDCDQRGDVCDRETVASDKLLSIQLAIHPFESLTDDRTLRFAVVRELLESRYSAWHLRNRAGCKGPLAQNAMCRRISWAGEAPWGGGPMRPRSSAPQNAKRTPPGVWVGPGANRSAASSTTAEPLPLSLIPGPSGTLSRCAPTMIKELS